MHQSQREGYPCHFLPIHLLRLNTRFPNILTCSNLSLFILCKQQPLPYIIYIKKKNNSILYRTYRQLITKKKNTRKFQHKSRTKEATISPYLHNIYEHSHISSITTFIFCIKIHITNHNIIFMTVMKIMWKSIFPSCYKAEDTEYSSAKETTKVVATKTNSFNRISLTDLSFPSATTLSEDLSISLAGSNLYVFTLSELKIITQGFSSTNFLGEGGFGPVHKGFIDDKVRHGLEPQPVAVKLLDLDGSQGHKEWLTEVVFLGQLRHEHLVKLIGYCCEEEHRLLVYEYLPRGSLENQLFRRYSASLPWSTRMKIAVGAAKGLAFLHGAKKPVIYRDFKASNILLDSDYNAKLSDFGLAKDGPEGDDTHVSTRVMGTQGYAAPEYIMTGHLTAMSDVYSFGVVLLELLTGRRSVDKARPPREHNLVEWARPVLNDARKLTRIMDPRLEGQYSEMGARKAAALAYQCLSHRPRNRPTMSTVVNTLEPLQDFDDVPIGPFVYTAPSDVSNNEVKSENNNIDTPKERKRESTHHHHRRNQHEKDGEEYYDNTKEKRRESGENHRRHHHHRQNGHRHPLKSPKEQRHVQQSGSHSHSPDTSITSESRGN